MAAALAAGVSIGWRLHDACAVLVGANAAAEHQARQEAASAKAVRLLASAGARQRTIYSVIEKEVPRLVAQDVVDRCPVPVGFVRLHDAAAQGMPTLPDPAGRPDDAASGLGLDTVAGAVVGNYETCNAIRVQLSALQAWTLAQSGSTAAESRGPR